MTAVTLACSYRVLNGIPSDREILVNILIFPFGSHGDVHPMVGLGLALRSRGHDVTIAAAGYFRELIERVGLDYVEQGTREEFLAALAHPDLWSPRRSFAHIFRSGVSRAMRPQFELVAERMKRGPLVVVNSALGFGARTARDKLGVPLATVHLQPGIVWSRHDTPVLPGAPAWFPGWLKRALYAIGVRFVIDPVVDADLNGFRRELGLPPVKKTTFWWNSPDQNIFLFPEWYGPPQPDWPQPLTMGSFPLWDESDIHQPEAELNSFLDSGSAPIVFAPGSANAQAADFFREAVEACTRLDRRGVLLTKFPEQLPAALPATVKAFRYIPFSQVLPRSAALVHHGGIGTAAQALKAGIPHLVMPLAHDQPDNAARLKKLGVADVLPPAKFTGARVAERLSKLLASNDVRRRCENWRAELAEALPFEAACVAIESLRPR